MPDSIEAVWIILSAIPGFVGFIAFNAVYCRTIKDASEQVGYIALLSVLAASFAQTALGLNLYSGAFAGEGAAASLAQSALTNALVLSFIAVIFGVLIAAILNLGLIQNLAIWCRISKKTSHESVLEDVISCNPDSFLKIRFKSGGYVLGHVRKYSLDGAESTLFLDKASRRPAKRDGVDQPQEYAIVGPGVLLLNFDDVSCVELLDGESS